MAAQTFLRDHPDLLPFLLSSATPTGRTIGTGSYGSVEEVAIPGAVCAAKKIHDFFQDPRQMPRHGIEKAASEFVRECQLMSTLQHPHIVQFLGVCFLPGSRMPALVMEKLVTSLHDVLDPEPPPTCTPFIPASLKRSILHDVARGISFLHSITPDPIIHRDLSARNVLLNEGMVAKIADLGMARIVQDALRPSTMTKAPGASIYMPPEALEDKSRYDTTIDIFSFGVVAIFTFSQMFPDPLAAAYEDDSGRMVGRTELERRGKYMAEVKKQFREGHPLIRMIQQCMKNKARQRPNIDRVCGWLEEARGEVGDGEFDVNKLSLTQLLQSRNTTISLQRQENSILRQQVQGLKEENAVQKAQITSLEELVQSLRAGNTSSPQEEKRRQEEYERSLCKFRLFARHPVTGASLEKKIEVQDQWSLQDTVTAAHKILGLENVVPSSRCRLVRYDEYAECLDQSYQDDPEKEETFSHMVGGPRIYYSYELYLEIREESEVFKPYNKGGLNLKVLVVDVEAHKMASPVTMRAEQSWTVLELKTAVSTKFGLAVETMNVAVETYQNKGRHLSTDSHLLKNESLFKKHTVFVCSDEEDFKIQFRESEMNKLIEVYVNSILLYVTIPPLPQPHPVDTTSSSSPSSPTVDMTKDRPLQRIEVRIDRRKTVQNLKELLADYVRQPVNNFKIYRLYSNNQEYEMSRLNDHLSTMPNETQLIARLGRALLPGEFRVRLSLLHMDEPEFCKPLLGSIVTKGMKVRDFKIQLIKEAYNQGIEYPLQLDRIRLRKKTWKTASTIYLDHQMFDTDIHIFSNFELYVEPLKGPEVMKVPDQMQVYLKQWRPSRYTVEPIREIILDFNTTAHLRARIAEATDIPLENVMFGKAHTSFPGELSVLDLEDGLEWNPNVSNVSSMPLCIYDDGAVLYYKDSREKLAKLTTERRAEIQKNERSKSSGSHTGTTNYHYHAKSRK